jgi:hypothetical protein
MQKRSKGVSYDKSKEDENEKDRSRSKEENNAVMEL